MADIGVPQYIPTSSVPSGNDAPDIAAGVGAAAAAASAIYSQKKEDQLARDLEATAKDGLAVVTDPAEEELGYVFGREREQQLYDQLRSYQAQASQATGSVRAAVVNKAKRLTYEALKKNPSLSDRFKNEFNEFMGLNPDLDALGMYDESASSLGAQSRKQMDLIFEKGYGRPSEGGFGIPASVPFGSPEFVRKWFEKEDADTLMNNRIFMLNTIDVGAEFNLETGAAVLQESIGKNINAVDSYFKTVQAQGVEIAGIAKKIANGQASSDEMEIYNLWQQGGAQEAIQGFEQYKANFEMLKANIPPSARNSDRGKNTIAMLNDQIGYIDRWQAAFEGMAENPDLVKLMQIESEVRQTKWRENFPQQDKMVQRMQQIRPLLEYAEVIGLKDVMMKNKMGDLTIDGLEQYIVDSLTFGAEGIDRAQRVDPEEYRRGILRNKDNAEGAPYGGGTDQEQGQTAIRKLETAVIMDAGANQVYTEIGRPEESILFPSMGAQVAHVNELRTGNQYAQSTVDKVAELYGGTDVVDQVVAIRANPNQPPEAVAIAALGEELSDYIVSMPNGGMRGQIASLASDLDRKFGGVPLSSLVYVSHENLDKGQIRIKLRNDAENEVLTRDTTRYREASLRSASPSELRRTRRELDEAARAIETRLNNLLRFQAHVDFYKDQYADVPAYGITYKNMGLDLLFPANRGE